MISRLDDGWYNVHDFFAFFLNTLTSGVAWLLYWFLSVFGILLLIVSTVMQKSLIAR